MHKYSQECKREDEHKKRTMGDLKDPNWTYGVGVGGTVISEINNVLGRIRQIKHCRGYGNLKS